MMACRNSEVRPWRPPQPERADDPDSLHASVGRLIEELACCRRERDAALRERDAQRRRADAFLRHLERCRALLARPRPRTRPRLVATTPSLTPDLFD